MCAPATTRLSLHSHALPLGGCYPQYTTPKIHFVHPTGSDQIIVEVFVWDTEQAVSTLLDTFPSRPGMSDPKRMVFSWSWERYVPTPIGTFSYLNNRLSFDAAGQLGSHLYASKINWSCCCSCQCCAAACRFMFMHVYVYIRYCRCALHPSNGVERCPRIILMQRHILGQKLLAMGQLKIKPVKAAAAADCCNRYMLSSAVTNCYGVPDDQWTWANVSSSEAVLQAEQAWRDSKYDTRLVV